MSGTGPAERAAPAGPRGVVLGMQVIHAVWARGALCVWAEDASLPATAAAPAGRRPSRAPRWHPFAADPDALADLLAGPGGPAGDLARKAEADELVLWLPSAPDGPQAAPELIRPVAAAAGTSRRGPALGCWRVPALAFSPAAALAVLDALDRDDPGEAWPWRWGSLAEGRPGEPAAGEVALGEPPLAGAAPGEIVAGGSVAYWASVASFAADLAVRGRVLPDLVRGGEDWVACWEPVLTGHDARRAGELAGAMPPLCRAAEPGGEQPGPVLAAALGALADAAARARLAAGDPGWALLPPRRGRRPARVPVPERWVMALAGPDGRVEVATPEDEAEAAALAAGLAGWREEVQVPAGPVRTCFRLVEPDLAEPDPAEPDPAEPERPSRMRRPDGQCRAPWRMPRLRAMRLRRAARTPPGSPRAIRPQATGGSSSRCSRPRTRA